LVEIGRMYETIGKHSQAEETFRTAEELARGIGCSPRGLVGIRNSLCRAISARHRPQEYEPIARESLALLGGDTDCAEALWAELLISGRATRQEYVAASDALRQRERDVEFGRLAAERSREVLAQTIGLATDQWEIPAPETLQLDNLAEKTKTYLGSADTGAMADRASAVLAHVQHSAG
jgi:hypothetical protein